MPNMMRILAAALMALAVATAPAVTQPGTQQPGTQQPGTQQPGAQQPETQQPGAQQPGAQQPGTQQPGTQQPGTQNDPAKQKDVAKQVPGGKEKQNTEKPTNPLALDNPAIYQKSLAALTMLFVIAVLLESAFAIIFNWRVFLTYFSLRGVKTIIMVVVALIIVNIFDIDILANLIAAYTTPPPDGAVATPPPSGPVSKFITALILAGGSAGVYNIMRALGYRNDKREEEVSPRPSKNEAWVAVKVTRVKAVGEVSVMIGKAPQPPAGSEPIPIAGTIGFQRPSLVELLLRNVNRFPQNGGHTVEPDVPYKIVVEGRDRDGTVLTALGDKPYTFAKGAIVDFEVTL